MASSNVVRISPTLPPSAMNASAMSFTHARDGDADIVERSGNRRMRLANGDADAPYRLIVLEHGISDRAGGRFHQTIAPRAERIARRFHQPLIGHRVLELVTARGLLEIDVEHEIEHERLPDLALVRHYAVIGMQHEPVDEDRVAHRVCLIAAATASACTVGATSCARTIAAPFSTASRWAAIEPPRRSIGCE